MYTHRFYEWSYAMTKIRYREMHVCLLVLVTITTTTLVSVLFVTAITTFFSFFQLLFQCCYYLECNIPYLSEVIEWWYLCHSHCTAGAPRTDDHVTYTCIAQLVDEWSGGTQTITLHQEEQHSHAWLQELINVTRTPWSACIILNRHNLRPQRSFDTFVWLKVSNQK